MKSACAFGEQTQELFQRGFCPGSLPGTPATENVGTQDGHIRPFIIKLGQLEVGNFGVLVYVRCARKAPASPGSLTRNDGYSGIFFVSRPKGNRTQPRLVLPFCFTRNPAPFRQKRPGGPLYTSAVGTLVINEGAIRHICRKHFTWNALSLHLPSWLSHKLSKLYNNLGNTIDWCNSTFLFKEIFA